MIRWAWTWEQVLETSETRMLALWMKAHSKAYFFQQPSLLLISTRSLRGSTCVMAHPWVKKAAIWQLAWKKKASWKSIKVPETPRLSASWISYPAQTGCTRMSHQIANKNEKTFQRSLKSRQCSSLQMVLWRLLDTKITRSNSGRLMLVSNLSTAIMWLHKWHRSASLVDERSWQLVTILTSWTSTRCGHPEKNSLSTTSRAWTAFVSPSHPIRLQPPAMIEALNCGTSLVRIAVLWPTLCARDRSVVLSSLLEMVKWWRGTRMANWGYGTCRRGKSSVRVARPRLKPLQASRRTTKTSTCSFPQRITFWQSTIDASLSSPSRLFRMMSSSAQTEGPVSVSVIMKGMRPYALVATKYASLTSCSTTMSKCCMEVKE